MKIKGLREGPHVPLFNSCPNCDRDCLIQQVVQVNGLVYCLFECKCGANWAWIERRIVQIEGVHSYPTEKEQLSI